MTATPPTISVVIPLYNHSAYIQETLESVFRQTRQPQEVIVVDDGSPDDSYALVQKHFGDRKELIAWTRPNGGAHSAINDGIRRASSDVIAILNSDDIFDSRRLEACAELFRNNPEADMVCTGINCVNDQGKSIRNTWYDEAKGYYRKVGDLALALLNGNFLMTTSNYVVHRAAFERYGYFGSFRYAHDLAFLLRLIRRGGRIVIDDTPLLNYRIHDSNTISEGAQKVKVEWAAIVAEHMLAVEQGAGGPPDIDRLRTLQEILDRHNLARMLPPLMALLARNSELDQADILLEDASVKDFLLEICQ